MAGIGSRFADYGFNTNKYMLPINTELTPMIELAITSLCVSVPCSYLFIIREEDGKRDEELRSVLDSICQKHDLSYQLVSVSKLTEGPASTVYEAIHALDMSHPMLVSNTDQVLEWEFETFYKACQQEDSDGCVLTYTPSYPLVLGSKDKHSFLRIDEDEPTRAIQFAEKIVLSNHALVGVHYFKQAQSFLDAYKYMVELNLRAPNGEFYLSLAYQAMLEKNQRVSFVSIESMNGIFYPVGEPKDYFDYLYTRGGYNGKNLATATATNNIVQYDYQKYEKDTLVKNKGLLILVRGTTDVIRAYEITTQDVYTHSECYMVSIRIRIPFTLPNATNIWKRSDFIRGWFIGNFTPSILKTSLFEAGLLEHKKGEKWPYHYHKVADEYNILIEGAMLLNERRIESGQSFTISHCEIACPIFLEDCLVLCIKIPSCPQDKYVV